MRNFIGLLVFFCFTISGFAQCKVEEDAFTKEKVAKFEWERLVDYAHPPFVVSYLCKNNEVTLTLTWSFKGKIEVVLPKQSDVLLKLENSEILKYSTKSEAIPQLVNVPAAAQVWSKYMYSFIVPMSDLEKIIKNKVSLVRLVDPSNGGTVDVDHFNKGIKKGAECVTGK